MRELLEALTAWPDVDTEDLRRRLEWEQARSWGWVMQSGELTGTGLAHAHELAGGSFLSSRDPEGLVLSSALRDGTQAVERMA